MQRALELAAMGHGHVSTNPMVGSVIVHDNRIIGEGWHQRFGGPHAEVNAIESVSNKQLLPDSTVYVTLEPCSHHGKTPPCADMLVTHKVKKVVIACLDTNPLVAGQGVRKLTTAGIEVVTGVLGAEAREQNKRFFTYMEKQRPYIILKWAQTSDGFIARENYDSKWISNQYARQLVHKWRTEEDAVLVGVNTALHDNPRLNVRDWSGRNPVRIVIDRHLKLNPELHLFDGVQKTICYNVLKDAKHLNLSLIRINPENFIQNIIGDLYRQRIQSVIVEGGAQTLNLFIAGGLWDEARIFISPQHFGKGIKAPFLEGTQAAKEDVMGDTLMVYRNDG